MKMRAFAIGARYLLGGSALVLFAVILFAAQDSGPNFSPWDQAVAVGPPIRTDDNYEGCPFISKSGLDLYFRMYSQNPDTLKWSWNIFVSHRDSIEDDWEDPINLGTNINSDKSELCSFVTIDGHWIYFVSNRTGAIGGSDLWVSHRQDKRNDQGWEPPINLGPNVNGTSGEAGPCIFEDETTGQITLYFNRSVSGLNKIFSCPMLDKVTTGVAAPVDELNKAGASDWHAFVRRKDGLEVIFCSDRDTLGMSDLFVSTRPTTMDSWSTPVNLGPNVNSDRVEGRPSISWDGTTLYFWTDREPDLLYPGYWQMKIYQATRTKITGKDK